MRTFLAALALACALFPRSVPAADATVRVAQMARDVTDAVRKQRAQQGVRPRTGDRITREGKQ